MTQYGDRKDGYYDINNFDVSQQIAYNRNCRKSRQKNRGMSKAGFAAVVLSMVTVVSSATAVTVSCMSGNPTKNESYTITANPASTAQTVTAAKLAQKKILNGTISNTNTNTNTSSDLDSYTDYLSQASGSNDSHVYYTFDSDNDNGYSEAVLQDNSPYSSDSSLQSAYTISNYAQSYIYTTYGKASYGYDYKYAGGLDVIDIHCDYDFKTDQYTFTLSGLAQGPASLTLYHMVEGDRWIGETMTLNVDNELNVTRIA